MVLRSISDSIQKAEKEEEEVKEEGEGEEVEEEEDVVVVVKEECNITMVMQAPKCNLIMWISTACRARTTRNFQGRHLRIRTTYG